MGGPEGEGEGETQTSTSRRAAIALALRLSVTTSAGLMCVGAVWRSEWLGGRAWAAVGLGGAAAVAIWWPSGGRVAAGWAAVCGAAGGVAAATGLGRIAPGEAVPGQGHGAGLTDRVLGRDLPPRGVYVAVVAAGALVVACGALALLRLARSARLDARRLGAGVLGGVLVSTLITAAVVGVAGELRELADRRAESGAVTAARARPAERIAVAAGSAPGPASPSQEAWRFEPSGAEQVRGHVRGVAAVPGWDVVVVQLEHEGPGDPAEPTNPIVALSKSDGSVLWRYWRRDGPIAGIAVDPHAGRVLLVTHRATVVLALEDGSRLAARPLPDGLTGAHLLGGGLGGSHSTPVTLGPAAVVTTQPDAARRRFGVVEVASGQVLATRSIQARDACGVTPLATTSPLVVVSWGPDSACGPPQLLRFDGQRLRAAAIAAPGDRTRAAICSGCSADRVIATDDMIVVSVAGSFPARSDLVALSPDGEVLWQASAAADAGEPAGGNTRLVAVTDWGVVAQWGEQWHLLSPTDGTERARQSRCGDAFYAAADHDRIYVVCERLAVLRIRDLSVVAEGGPDVEWDVAFAADDYLITGLWTGDVEQISALTD